MTEVLGICGSARKKGNTAKLLEEVLKATGMESELIFLSDLNVGFCLGCLSCVKNKGVCAKIDDMKALVDKMLAAKAIVLGTPNYYYSISGLMKNMIDRTISTSYLGIGEYTGMDWHGWRPFVDKVGGAVICQAAFGGEQARGVFECLAEYSGLNLVGSVIASCGAQSVDDFPEYREEAKKLGEKIREVSKGQGS
jgi:multimeric flavodoxin WrbA